MSGKKPVYGLVLEPQKPYATIFRQVFDFNVVAGENTKKGNLFVTNHALQSMLEKHQAVVWKQIGKVQVQVNSKKKRIYFISFYPFGGGYPDETPIGKFMEIGIGGFIFNVLSRDLAKRFPNYQARYGKNNISVEFPAKTMLWRMSLDYKKWYPIETFVQKSRQYVADMMRVKRPKPAIRPRRPRIVTHAKRERRMP